MKMNFNSALNRCTMTQHFPKLIGAFIASICVIFQFNAFAAATNADFYVATDGSDANIGTYAQPFATVARARDAVRPLVAAGLKRDVKVLLRGGIYELPEPLVFGPQDSGTTQHSITYANYPGERAEISGGRRITGWTKDAGGLWTTTIPEVKSGAWYFRQLFADNVRRQRARTPNTGFFNVVGDISLDNPATFQSTPGDIKPECRRAAMSRWSRYRRGPSCGCRFAR